MLGSAEKPGRLGQVRLDLQSPQNNGLYLKSNVFLGRYLEHCGGPGRRHRLETLRSEVQDPKLGL